MATFYWGCDRCKRVFPSTQISHRIAMWDQGFEDIPVDAFLGYRGQPTRPDRIIDLCDECRDVINIVLQVTQEATNGPVI